MIRWLIALIRGPQPQKTELPNPWSLAIHIAATTKSAGRR